MKFRRYYELFAVLVTLLGVAIAVGSLLDGLVALPIVDGDDLLVGAGIAVAGAGTMIAARSGTDPDEPDATDGPSPGAP
jgi:hypothetical protein